MASAESILENSMALTKSHYENFPVASILLPKQLREPIALIYQFARQADDFADEGDFTQEERLKKLNAFQDDLDLYVAYIKPANPFFSALGDMVKAHQLPFQPFYDLLTAFKQDVIKTRYETIDEVMDYCACSANPIGLLLLHLYQAATPQNIAYSNQICTALQLINFIQDVGIDFNKNEGKQRIYLTQEELSAFGISETMIADYVQGIKPIDPIWSQLIGMNLHRAKALLYAGSPLGSILKGRIGFEMRMIIAGGERIIAKLAKVDGDVFNKRPVLTKRDWILVFLKALFRS
jgi:squalene synthase HpnC